MPAKRKVLDIWLSLFLYIGAFLTICSIGMGFVAQAEDRSPRMYWIAAPFFMIPFILFVWLMDTGRIEVVDTRKVEKSLIKMKTPRLPTWALILLGLWGTLCSILSLTDKWTTPIIVDWITKRCPEIPHLHLFMWGVFFFGATGAIWQYRRVIRAVNTPTTPTPPGTGDPPTG